jgi:hypothetical protein
MSVDILLPIMAVGAVLFVSEMLARGKKARERLAERMDMTVLPTLEQNWNDRRWNQWGRWNPLRILDQNDPHRDMGMRMSKLRLFSHIKDGKAINWPLNTFRHLLHCHSKSLGLSDEVKVTIFEYQVIASPWFIPLYLKLSVQTVMLFQDKRLNFPEFAARPERFRHKLGSTLHLLNDIDFESDSTAVEFSKQYLLNGPEYGEPQIRKLFTDEVLACFADKDEIWVDGAGDQLIFYRADKALQPREEHFRPFVEEAVEVFRVLSESNGQPT